MGATGSGAAGSPLEVTSSYDGPLTSATPEQAFNLPATPMLDAAMARLEALRRQQHESVAAAGSTAERKDQKAAASVPKAPLAEATRPRPSDSPAFAVRAPSPKESPQPAPSSSTRQPAERVRAGSVTTADPKTGSSAGESGKPKTPERPPAATPAPTPSRSQTNEAASDQSEVPPLPPLGSATAGDVGPDDSSTAETRREGSPPPATTDDNGAPLAITELRLCQRIYGFGCFEPVDETTLRAGQRLLLYCEVTGVHSELSDGAYYSKLSSWLEVRPTGFASCQWRQELGTAEDVCRRRRRDYYVNYRIEVPGSMPPGPYTMRLIQKDELSQARTSAEIPIEIVE
jgi:hypothetical protein